MHFDAALDAGVVRHLDVRVTSADMREHDDVLTLQHLEEIVRAVGVGFDVRQIVDQRVV